MSAKSAKPETSDTLSNTSTFNIFTLIGISAIGEHIEGKD